MSSKDSSNQQLEAQNVSSYKEIIRQTIADCVTLSDETKKEVLQWFSNKCDGSRHGSPCGTRSPIIAGSRKRRIHSENISELNFEVPKKCKKLSESDQVLPDKENVHPIDAGHVQTDKVRKSPRYADKKSFLASLSKDVPLENADPQAVTYRVEYWSKKEELCTVLYKEFNEKVFDNKLPKDLLIEWSDKLQNAAGKYKYYSESSSKSLEKTILSSKIVLATKILDSPDKLRDTLIHEMCHAAARLIDNVRDDHGSIWKSWANKAVKAFPELITISRCHDYKIETKYTYKCTCCGHGIGRQVTSLNLNRHRCRYCHGPFVLLINKITDAGLEQKKIAASTNEPSGFALYVKEKYHVLKQSEPSMDHAEIITTLKQQFSLIKAVSK